MSKRGAAEWHSEVITASTATALRSLRGQKLLDRFYLAGGTGLALHLGHRLSQDLDFFSEDLFAEELLLQRLQAVSGFALAAKAPHTLHTSIQAIKVSFLGYAYPVLFPFTRFLEVAVADARDIACMKLSAIASRGTKRDFVDLYFAARQFGLHDLLQFFGQKYSRVRYNRLHILKSLMFFEDAEKDPMPHILAPVEWADLKRFFQDEVTRLGRNR